MSQDLSHIAIIATDLDDTLISRGQDIPPRTLDLFRRWEARGNRVLIATGRPPRSVRGDLPHALAHIPLICYNGAVAFEDGKTVYEQYIPGPITQAIVERLQARAPNARIGLEIDDALFLNQEPPRPALAGHTVVDLRTVAHRPAAKILLRRSQADLLGDALDDLPDGVQVMVSNRYDLIQVMPAGVDKANALAALVARWGLGLEHVIAFGDDVNDVGMLQRSAIGVAVRNAVPEVLAVADRVTGTPDEQGVADVVEWLMTTP